MSVEESESFRCKLGVTLSSDTPVVGIEINPHVFVHKLASLSFPELTFSFSWLRNHKKTPISRYGIDYPNGTEEENESIGVGIMKSYVPTLDDLGSTLSLVCVAIDPSSGTQLSEASVVTTNRVITPPVSQLRRMIKCSPSSSNIGPGCDSATGPTFRVLTYNVLADLYTRLDGGSRYDFCPKWARVWEYRRELLLCEILGYNADILCLQEVQSDHFEDFFKPELTNCGYSVLYKKKPSKDYMAHGLVSDGCATFYRSNLFNEVIKHELEFDKITMRYLRSLGHDDEISHRLCKDNVALVVVLETLDNESYKDSSLSRICVVNTHISADLPVIKLFQVVSLVNELMEKFDPEIPILICGDFNSRPTSDPHAYIVTGNCNPSYNKKQDPLRIVEHLNLHHFLDLTSAYASFPVPVGDEEGPRKISTETNEPMFTYMAARSSGTLDYIFYTEKNLRVDHLLDLLDHESVRPGLPSPYWPSDHIALMAGFRLKQSPCSAQSSTSESTRRPALALGAYMDIDAMPIAEIGNCPID